jgi:hypothetical protein
MGNRSASGLRKRPLVILTTEDIEFLRDEIKTIGADETAFRFNEGAKTGFSDDEGIINVRGDVHPDLNSTHPRDKMSQRAVLAHEYYGHYKYSPSQFKVGDWRDEFRASYVAAIVTPNLSSDDRRYLILDAYERAKEQGHYFSYSKKAREIIYGR